MPLTDTAIRAAKPRRKAYKLADGGGMYLLVHPNGSRYWRMDYRFLGKRKSLALGLYPQLPLGEARAAREAAKKQLANGEDPSAQKKLQKITGRISAENSFRAVGEEWLAKCEREGRAEITLTKKRWLLAFAFPVLGEQPIAEISAPEVLAVLRTVEVRGKHETARRLRSTCSAVFRYAIATGRAEQDPTMALRGALTAPQVTYRAAITDPKAVGALLRAIEGFEGQPTYDPMGRRVHKSGAGVSETFFLDSGDDEIAEYDGSGNLLRRYVPGPSIDRPVAMVDVSGSSTVLSYFHTDERGSVITMGELCNKCPQ